MTTECTACQNPDAQHVVGDSEIYCDPCAASLCRLALDIEAEIQGARVSNFLELTHMVKFGSRKFTGRPGVTSIGVEMVRS